jgi:hypothetical protein
MVSMEEQAQPDHAILAFLAQSQYQAFDVGRRSPRAELWAALETPESVYPRLSVAFMPIVKLAPRNPEEATGLADIAGDLLEMLDVPPTHLNPTSELPLRWPGLHPATPFSGALETLCSGVRELA